MRQGAGLWWAPAVIVLVAVLVYSNSLTGPFVFDDVGTIVDNRTHRGPGKPRRCCRRRTRRPSPDGPVANVSFALNYAVGGRDVDGLSPRQPRHPRVVRARGVRHRAARAAFRRTPRWRLRSSGRSTRSTPKRSTYVTQRTESLMALFYLTTLYCAIRAHEAGSGGGRWEAAAVAACALGMATKESMVTAPIAVVALRPRVPLRIDPRGGSRARTSVRRVSPPPGCCSARLMWSSPAEPLGRLLGARCRRLDLPAQPDGDDHALPVARGLAARSRPVLRMAVAADAGRRPAAGGAHRCAPGADGAAPSGAGRVSASWARGSSSRWRRRPASCRSRRRSGPSGGCTFPSSRSWRWR